MFASQVTKEIRLMDGELAVIIQKLSGSSLKKAREVRQIADMQRTKHMGGEVLRVFRETDSERKAAAASGVEAPPPPPKTVEELKKERFESFDRDDVLTRGIRSWSSTVKLIDGITDLDEADAQDAFEAILDLALGPVVPADAKAASEEGKEKAS